MSSGRVSAILESGTARGERGGRLGRGAGGGGQYALVDRGGAAGGLDAGLDGLGDCAVCGVRFSALHFPHIYCNCAPYHISQEKEKEGASEIRVARYLP